MRDPLVSVMMPCWNASGTLRFALASLLAQTYQNWECVVVDDGSTDNPRAIIEEAADSRIRYVRLARRAGRGAARQRALEEVKGDLVTMLDADDWIFPEKLERQVHAILSTGVPLVSTGMSIVTERNEIVGVRAKGPSGSTPAINRPMKRPGAPPVAFSPSMIQRAAVRTVAFDRSLEYSEDVDFLLSILLVHPFAILPDITYAYTEYASASLTKTVATLKCCRRIFRKYRNGYPVSSRFEVAKAWGRSIAYRGVFALGLDRAAIARRSEAPGDDESRAFLGARSIVTRILSERFPCGELPDVG